MVARNRFVVDHELEVTEEFTLPIKGLTALEFEYCYLIDVKNLVEHCKDSINE